MAPWELEDVQAQDLFHDLLRLTPVGGDAILGLLVIRQALTQKLSKAFGLAKEWAIVDPLAAQAEFFERTIEPDGGTARRADEVEVGFLGEGTAAQSDDGRLRSINCQPSSRASSPPTVVLPLPMKPKR